METEYEWDCTRVDAYPLNGANTDVVYKVHWEVRAYSMHERDSKGMPFEAAIVGIEDLEASNITTFVPFNELTNEIVTEWVKIAMGVEELTTLELELTNQILELMNPTSLSLIIGQPIP